jgi:hypothetical protein
MKSLQCGFYFHPKDKDLSLGTRLRKKLLFKTERKDTLTLVPL